jgi:hypothetical protein
MNLPARAGDAILEGAQKAASATIQTVVSGAQRFSEAGERTRVEVVAGWENLVKRIEKLFTDTVDDARKALESTIKAFKIKLEDAVQKIKDVLEETLKVLGKLADKDTYIRLYRIAMAMVDRKYKEILEEAENLVKQGIAYIETMAAEAIDKAEKRVLEACIRLSNDLRRAGNAVKDFITTPTINLPSAEEVEKAVLDATLNLSAKLTAFGRELRALPQEAWDEAAKVLDNIAQLTAEAEKWVIEKKDKVMAKFDAVTAEIGDFIRRYNEAGMLIDDVLEGRQPPTPKPHASLQPWLRVNGGINYTTLFGEPNIIPAEMIEAYGYVDYGYTG